MDLTALADFNLVARHGGFGRAARATGRPKTSLSRHVAALEAELGLRLFERGVREPKLTQEGRLLHERTSALLGEVDEVGANIRSGARSPSGVLRVSAPVLFGQVALGRLFAAFLHHHPEMRIEARAEDRLVDPVEEGYDLIIRVNPAPDATLVGRKFFQDKLVVVAAPEIAPASPGRPARAVTLMHPAPTAWRVVADGGEQLIHHRSILSLSSWHMVRDAIGAGAGAAVLPLSMVRSDVAAGRLNHWGDVVGGEVELWALYPSRRLLRRRVSTFIEFLISNYEKDEGLSLAPDIRP